MERDGNKMKQNVSISYMDYTMKMLDYYYRMLKTKCNYFRVTFTDVSLQEMYFVLCYLLTRTEMIAIRRLQKKKLLCGIAVFRQMRSYSSCQYESSCTMVILCRKTLSSADVSICFIGNAIFHMHAKMIVG